MTQAQIFFFPQAELMNFWIFVTKIYFAFNFNFATFNLFKPLKNVLNELVLSYPITAGPPHRSEKAQRSVKMRSWSECSSRHAAAFYDATKSLLGPDRGSRWRYRTWHHLAPIRIRLHVSCSLGRKNETMLWAVNYQSSWFDRCQSYLTMRTRTRSYAN